MLSLSMMAYPLFTITITAAQTGWWPRLFMLLAIKQVCMLGLWGCCISEGNIQALTSCGGAEHTNGHVIAVKFDRGGAASMSPTQRWSATILNPLWLKGKISATLTAACQRQTALRWHWQIPPALHPYGVPPLLSRPRSNIKPQYLFDISWELVPRIILPDVKFHVRVHR